MIQLLIIRASQFSSPCMGTHLEGRLNLPSRYRSGRRLLHDICDVYSIEHKSICRVSVSFSSEVLTKRLSRIHLGFLKKMQSDFFSIMTSLDVH